MYTCVGARMDDSPDVYVIDRRMCCEMLLRTREVCVSGAMCVMFHGYGVWYVYCLWVWGCVIYEQAGGGHTVWAACSAPGAVSTARIKPFNLVSF